MTIPNSLTAHSLKAYSFFPICSHLSRRDKAPSPAFQAPYLHLCEEQRAIWLGWTHVTLASERDTHKLGSSLTLLVIWLCDSVWLAPLLPSSRINQSKTKRKENRLQMPMTSSFLFRPLVSMYRRRGKASLVKQLGSKPGLFSPQCSPSLDPVSSSVKWRAKARWF